MRSKANNIVYFYKDYGLSEKLYKGYGIYKLFGYNEVKLLKYKH